MKKFLSLVLALVMVMSLVTVSAGAKDFTDGSKVQYKEAVDVMSAVKVIDGYTDGSFDPQGTLTRGAAAKIICNLILGPTTASALRADTAPYKDVPVNHTFAGYIAYCQQQGIISGYADGTFRPGATLTNYAFMKMLLGALGYDADIEGYVGDNWSIAVAKRALNIGLTDGLVDEFVGTEAATREEACLYALNTLTADMVDYDSRASVTVGGAEVVFAGSKAEVMKNDSKNETIDDDDVMQFAEKYFTNLKLKDGSDDFARPANVWTLKAEEIGTYAKTPDATYTKKVESGDIYKDLSLGSTIEKKDVEIYVDGEEIDDVVAIKKSSDVKVGESDNGVLTEVFYDDDDDTVTITQVNTYVGQISKTVAATSKKDAYVVIAASDVRPATKLEFETNEEFEDDEYVLYTYSLSADEVKSVASAELVSGTATETQNSKKDEDANKSITIEDTAYKFSAKSAGVQLGEVSVDVDYDVYLDAYGYAIYVEEVDEIGEYALVMAAQDKGDFSSNRALLVFADGTEKVVDTAKNYKDGTNALVPGTIVTYKEDSDGDYTLKAVTSNYGTSLIKDGAPTFARNIKTAEDFHLKNDKAGVVIAKDDTDGYRLFEKDGSKSVSSKETGKLTVNTNSKTIFVVYNIEDDDYSVYTGIKEAPTIEATNDKPVYSYTYVKSGMAKVMFIFVPDSSIIEDENTKMLFLAGESVSNLKHNSQGDYYEFQGVVNDEISENIKVADDVVVDGTGLTSSQVKELNGLFASYSVDKNGIITRLTSYDPYNNDEAKGAVNGKKDNTPAVGIDKRSADYTVIVGTTTGPDATITVADDADIYYVNEDGDVAVSAYKSIAKDEDDYVYAVVKDYMVQALFIEEVNVKDEASGTATIDPDADQTVKVGDDAVVLTVSAEGKTKKDEAVSYQWYKDTDDSFTLNDKKGTVDDATKISGATKDTYTVSTNAESAAYYFCVVEFYNDRVDGQDTKYVATSSIKVTVGEADKAPMTVTVKTYLRDASGNIPLDEKNITIKEGDNTKIEAPEYDDYTVSGSSSKSVEFVSGGTAAVTFVYNAKVVTKIEVTTPPTSTEVNSGGDFNPAGMVVTATYDNGTTANVTEAVELSDNTNLNTAGKVTITYEENGTTVTTTVDVTIAS